MRRLLGVTELTADKPQLATDFLAIPANGVLQIESPKDSSFAGGLSLAAEGRFNQAVKVIECLWKTNP